MKISTHTPLAGRDPSWNPNQEQIQISTHTPLAGRDLVAIMRPHKRQYFYSHAPRGARRLFASFFYVREGFLLTRPSRGATIIKMMPRPGGYISTHTPLAGRDLHISIWSHSAQYFYSHAPRGARPNPPLLIPVGLTFLLTRPSRGATLEGHDRPDRKISTHTPLAGRDVPKDITNIAWTYFYSHAPRGARPLAK